MKKIGIYILVGVGVLLLILGVILYSVVSSLKPTAAHLTVNKGSVELMAGKAWVETSDADLKEGDTVRTLGGSEATIIFFETSFVKLFPETELEIKELDAAEAKVVLKQDSGKTWNEVIRRQEAGDGLDKLVGLLGVNNYDVELPNAVASVRGTSFGIDLTEDRLVVLKGTVNLLYSQTKPGEEVSVRAGMETGKAAGITKPGEAVETGKIELKPLEKDNFVTEGQAIREKGFNAVKGRIKMKYAKVLDVAKDEYQLTDEEIDRGIDDYLRGKLDLRTLQAADTEGITASEGMVKNEAVAEETVIENKTRVSIGKEGTELNKSIMVQEPESEIIVIR